MNNQLAALRKQKKITQEELADAAGVTRQYICKIEKGTNVNVTVRVLFAIAKKLEVRISDIFLD